jgi:hypothetical protein
MALVPLLLHTLQERVVLEILPLDLHQLLLVITCMFLQTVVAVEAVRPQVLLPPETEGLGVKKQMQATLVFLSLLPVELRASRPHFLLLDRLELLITSEELVAVAVATLLQPLVRLAALAVNPAAVAAVAALLMLHLPLVLAVLAALAWSSLFLTNLKHSHDYRPSRQTLEP